MKEIYFYYTNPRINKSLNVLSIAHAVSDQGVFFVKDFQE